MKHEKFITLWRPNNAGYCMNKEWAGVYETYEEGYHDTDESLPIKIEDAEKLFIEDTKHWGEPHRAIPNHKSIWDILNVKMTKNGLVKSKAGKQNNL
jgi:hypothetical protein